MWPTGQKTKLVHFWLAPEDIAEFSAALHVALPDMPWQCSHAGPNPPVHDFNTLQAALQCDEISNPYTSQAFAPLALSALQFQFCLPQRLTNAQDGYAPDYAFPADITAVNYGRMAIRWDAHGADEATLQVFSDRLALIWKTFQRCTLPAKVHTLSGRPLAGFRIGKQMLEKARQDKLYLKANGPFCLAD